MRTHPYASLYPMFQDSRTALWIGLRDSGAELARAQHRLLCGIRDIHSRKRREGKNHRDLITWIAASLDIESSEAEAWIEAAYALERLPLTDAAFAAGRIGLGHVLELTRLATLNTERKLLREMLCAMNYPWWPNGTPPSTN